jgi:hypothetical protein
MRKAVVDLCDRESFPSIFNGGGVTSVSINGAEIPINRELSPRTMILGSIDLRKSMLIKWNGEPLKGEEAVGSLKNMQDSFRNRLVILEKHPQVELPKGICGLLENGSFAELVGVAMSQNDCPMAIINIPPGNEKVDDWALSPIPVIPLDKVRLGNGGGR